MLGCRGAMVIGAGVGRGDGDLRKEFKEEWVRAKHALEEECNTRHFSAKDASIVGGSFNLHATCACHIRPTASSA